VALVAALSAALAPEQPHDARLLAVALGAGRVRGIAHQLALDARANPSRAEVTLRTGLRDARALHSRERRLVADAVRDLIRWEALLDALLPATAAPELARWFAWMVHLGADAADAANAWTAAIPDTPAPDLAPFRDLPHLAQALLASLSATERLATLASVAPSVAVELERSLGEQAEAFALASSGRAPVVLRARGLEPERDRLVEALVRGGVDARPAPWARQGVVLHGRVNLDALPHPLRGRYEVQDEGSQLLSELVAPDRGLVIDLCAGAGGKSLALADRGAQVLALDVRAPALEELQKRASAARLRVRTELLHRDGGLPSSVLSLAGRATRVLVDAPCSGSGVLRRHPEYRWRLTDAPALAQTQGAILARAADLVAPGGRLVYGTCSVLRAENEDVVDAFLADHPAFQRLSVAQVLGDARASELKLARDLRVAPHSHHTDGFFGAVLQRRPS